MLSEVTYFSSGRMNLQVNHNISHVTAFRSNVIGRRGLARILTRANHQNTHDPTTPAIRLEPYQGTPLPTRMNNIPHTRSMRQHFYSEASSAVVSAIAAGHTRLHVRVTIPELNTDFDVYRVGTLLEMIREIATTIAADGKRVKVCVQQAIGTGVFQGTPLSLSGVFRIMKQMDWGDAGQFISLGNLGAEEIQEDIDTYILISPQNITGHSVLPLLEEMTEAADRTGKSIIIVNPKLGDVPSSNGVMSVRGRQGRQDYIKSFLPAYHFRLLYLGAGPYPIMGALRYTYGGPWQVLKRVDFVAEDGARNERFEIVGDFESEPDATRITASFKQKNSY